MKAKVCNPGHSNLYAVSKKIDQIEQETRSEVKLTAQYYKNSH